MRSLCTSGLSGSCRGRCRCQIRSIPTPTASRSTSVGVEDTMYLDIQDRDDCLRVRRLVHECLTEREEEVIISRYGLGGRMPRTQREVAKKLGISRSYVSRIEKRALEKLEEAIGERG